MDCCRDINRIVVTGDQTTLRCCGGVGGATDHVKAEWYVNKSLVIPK
jgi:hypothetical protein